MLKRLLTVVAVAACIGAMPALAQTQTPSNAPAATSDTGGKPTGSGAGEADKVKAPAHHAVRHVYRSHHWAWGSRSWHHWGYWGPRFHWGYWRLPHFGWGWHRHHWWW
jgi:hypothetical protein